MREDDFIVSKTDLKGRITYCNRIFIEFSGYSEAELLGAQHNIVRHPDMPRGVFQFLWDTLGQKTECFAYVKNMCRDGAFYCAGLGSCRAGTGLGSYMRHSTAGLGSQAGLGS